MTCARPRGRRSWGWLFSKKKLRGSQWVRITKGWRTPWLYSGPSSVHGGQRYRAAKRPGQSLPPHPCSPYPKTQGLQWRPDHKTSHKEPKRRWVAQH